MEKHQVDVIKFRKGERLIDLCLSSIIADIDDLGSEEDLVAGDERGSNCIAAAFFILVNGC